MSDKELKFHYIVATVFCCIFSGWTLFFLSIVLLGYCDTHNPTILWVVHRVGAAYTPVHIIGLTVSFIIGMLFFNWANDEELRRERQRESEAFALHLQQRGRPLPS